MKDDTLFALKKKTNKTINDMPFTLEKKKIEGLVLNNQASQIFFLWLGKWDLSLCPRLEALSKFYFLFVLFH